MSFRAPSLLVAAVLLLGGGQSALAANGPILSTIGSKGPVTFPVDGDAWSMFRMPSSIGWAWDSRVDVDLFYFYSRTTLRNSLNDFEGQGSSFGANGGVFFAPGRIDDDASDEEWDAYVHAQKITIGFGVYVDMAGGTGRASKVRWQTFPEKIPLRSGIQFVAPTLAVAFTPTEWLSVGLGLHASIATMSIRALTGGGSTPLGGSPQINGVPLPGNPTYSDFLDLFGNDDDKDPTTYFNGDLSTVQYAATLSISIKPNDYLGFGISYRPRSWAPNDFEGDGSVNATRTFTEALGGLDPSINDLFLQTLPNGGTQGFISDYDVTLRGLRVPRQVRLSAVFWPKPSIMIGAEVAWIEWHRAFRRFNLELKNGNNADVNFVTGTTEISSRLTQRWKNRWVYSLYAAFALNDYLTVRGGFNYSNTAINHNVANNSSSAALVTTNLSVGATLNVSRFSIHTLVEYSPYTSKEASLRPASVTGKLSKTSAIQLFWHLGVSVSF